MMTPRPSVARTPHRRRGGFTMTEMALCLAVVSIALVAIIGVLPTGLNVQRQNREETIVTEDAKVLLNALRTGAVASDNLLNNVDFILVERYPVTAKSPDLPQGTPTLTRAFYTPLGASYKPALTALGYTTQIQLTNAAQIVALMTAPRFVTVGQRDYFHVVRAQVRAIAGSLNEKPILTEGDPSKAGPDGLTRDQRTDFAFRYLVTPQVSPVPIAPNAGSTSQAVAVAQQIHDVSLTVQWPVVLRIDNTVERLRVGQNRRVVRSQVFGRLVDLNPNDERYLQSIDLGLQHFSPNSL